MRKSLLALSLALALFVPAACGGGDDDVERVSDRVSEEDASTGERTDLQRLMLASAEKAAANSSYRFEGRVGIPVGDQTVDMVMTGVADTSKPLMTMDMDMGAIPGFPPGEDTKMSMILDGNVFYMRFPAAMTSQTGLDLGGKSWAKLDLAALGEDGQAFDALLAQARQADPAAYLSLLSGATDDVTEVGTEEIRGTRTRHFKMTVDTTAVAENAPAELADASRSFIEQYGTGKVPVEVWIGDDDLPRRIAMTTDASTVPDAGALGATGTITTSIEMFDHGLPVDVALPPAEDIIDFAELLGAMPGPQ